MEWSRVTIYSNSCIPDDWARLFRFRAAEFALARRALVGNTVGVDAFESARARFIDPAG